MLSVKLSYVISLRRSFFCVSCTWRSLFFNFFPPPRKRSKRSEIWGLIASVVHISRESVVQLLTGVAEYFLVRGWYACANGKYCDLPAMARTSSIHKSITSHYYGARLTHSSERTTLVPSIDPPGQPLCARTRTAANRAAESPGRQCCRSHARSRIVHPHWHDTPTR